ncbi:MAG: helix-turn-helix transcriptional regulator [Prevotella sp.]|nr:helix-turn-helix transcriptional regulator [Prevotella sp.]
MLLAGRKDRILITQVYKRKEEIEIINRERLRRIRLERNLTQAELAPRVGIGVAYYSEIETGRKKSTIETLVAIAKTLD